MWLLRVRELFIAYFLRRTSNCILNTSIILSEFFHMPLSYFEYCWRSSNHAVSWPYFTHSKLLVHFSLCWPPSSYMCVTVCHHRWGRCPAAFHQPVEENTFEGAARSTGKIAFEELELQSSDWKGIWGLDFLAIIPNTYPEMGWYAIGWLPSSFSWGLLLSLSWLIWHELVRFSTI